MYQQLVDPKLIPEYRASLAARISAVLEQNESPTTVDEITTAIFDADQEKHAGEQLADLIRMFDAPQSQLDSIIALVQEARNYFPHRALDGRCPAEVMAQRMHVSYARPRRSDKK